MRFIKPRPNISPKVQSRKRVSKLTINEYVISHPAPIPVSGRHLALDIEDAQLVRGGGSTSRGKCHNYYIPYFTTRSTDREDTHVLFEEKFLRPN